MITLKFTRLFTKGNLVGLTHQDSLKTSSEQLAQEFVDCINENNADGVLDYKIVSFEIIK